MFSSEMRVEKGTDSLGTSCKGADGTFIATAFHLDATQQAQLSLTSPLLRGVFGEQTDVGWSAERLAEDSTHREATPGSPESKNYKRAFDTSTRSNAGEKGNVRMVGGNPGSMLAFIVRGSLFHQGKNNQWLADAAAIK